MLLPGSMFSPCPLSFSLLLAIALPGVTAAQMRQSNEIVNFRLRDGYLMIVQTMVNGAGPFNFLLDTGATHTVIDPALRGSCRLRSLARLRSPQFQMCGRINWCV
jgi:hypothetical protein